MKRILFLSGFIFLCFLVQAQQPDCSTIKNGTFKNVMIIEGQELVTMIYRDENKQIEENKMMGIKMEFVVKWTSPCTYELSKPKMLSGEMPGLLKTHKVFVKVLSVTNDAYTAEVSSNFSELTDTSDFLIIK